MFISYHWLKELTGAKLSPEDVRDRLTNVGLAVDAVETHSDDYVLDVEVPSNRGDCLCHVGIARELAVIEKAKGQSPKSKAKSLEGTAIDYAAAEIKDRDLCARYAARAVRSVKIAPSREWLPSQLDALA